MADVNSITVTGHLTRDAVTQTVGTNGSLVTKFAIANNTGFGQYARTQFFNVEIWGKGGAAVTQYLVKGKHVGISGKLENKSYEGKDGQMHDCWTITSSEVSLLVNATNTSSTPANDVNDPVF